MSAEMTCPACLSIYPGTPCHHFPQETSFDCNVCGIYTTESDLALQARSGGLNTGHWKLTTVQRTVLSHRIRLRHDIEMDRRHRQAASASDGPSDRQAPSGGWYRVTKNVLDNLRSEARQPTRAEQAENAIRFVGDRVSAQGETLREMPDEFRAVVGATNYDGGLWLLAQLQKKGLVDIGSASGEFRDHYDKRGQVYTKVLRSITLTLDGWQEYERAKRGVFAGNYGFVALQFNDPELDELLATTKAAVLEHMGYDLIDMRDVEQAGVIDNIMRLKIADSAFVLADLTHANPGAYWEAGYAEGLGKPVVYICKKAVFDNAGTHFDTNHCTTIPWSSDDPGGFCRRLIATLRRSLESR